MLSEAPFSPFSPPLLPLFFFFSSSFLSFFPSFLPLFLSPLAGGAGLGSIHSRGRLGGRARAREARRGKLTNFSN